MRLLRPLSFLLLSAALGLSLEGRAADAETCVLRLEPAGASPEWRKAADDARARLGKSDGADCREIVVHVALDGAVVEFATSDGRRAVRHVGQPSELGATIDALLVTLPGATDSSTEARSPPEEPPKTIAPVFKLAAPNPPDRPPSTSASSEDDRASHLRGALTLGARMGWPGRRSSPVLQAAAALGVHRWELGIFAQWEPEYGVPSGTLPAGIHMSAVAAGVSVARREPLGRWLALVAGVQLGGAIVEEEGDEQPDGLGGTQAEVRAGLTLGLVTTPKSALRFRTTLAFELVPSRLGRSPGLDPALPMPPVYGLTLLLGVEGDVL